MADDLTDPCGTGFDHLPTHIRRAMKAKAADNTLTAGNTATVLYPTSEDIQHLPAHVREAVAVKNKITTQSSSETADKLTNAMPRVKQVFHGVKAPIPPPSELNQPPEVVAPSRPITPVLPPHLAAQHREPHIKPLQPVTPPSTPSPRVKVRYVMPGTIQVSSRPKTKWEAKQEMDGFTPIKHEEQVEKKVLTFEEWEKSWDGKGEPPRVFEPPHVPLSQQRKEPEVPRRHIVKYLIKPPEPKPEPVPEAEEWIDHRTPPPSPSSNRAAVVKMLAEHGITVHPPQPANNHNKQNKANGQGHRRNNRQAKSAEFQALLSSSRDQQQGSALCNNPPASSNNATPRNNPPSSHNNPRAAARESHWPKKADFSAPRNNTRESRWPKKADFPKVRKTKRTYSTAGDSVSDSDPNRITYTWFEHDHIDDKATAVSSSNGGWSVQPNNPIEVGGVAYELCGYDGKFAPPPLDWDNRPAYKSLNTTQSIEAWLNGVHDSYPGVVCQARSTDDFVNGAMVLRDWVPTKFGKQTPMELWGDMMQTRARPFPVDRYDLVDVLPWWFHYQSEASQFLKPYNHPPEGGIDPSEMEADRIARENDFGNLQHADNLKRKEWAKVTARADRNAELKGLKKRFHHITGYEGPMRPGLNVYIRTARAEDLMQIRDIYNYYVNNTTTVRETKCVTAQAIEKHFLQAKTDGLPFLVAVQRGKRVLLKKLTERGQRDAWQEPDKVVGFTFAHNHDGKMPPSTAELKIFTAQPIHRYSVAKCLMDKFLALLDPGFPERAGYQLEGTNIGIGTHIQHSFKQFWIEFLYHEQDHLHWISRWLDEYKYRLMRITERDHVKHQRQVSIAHFCYKTTVQ